jgi:hypothetical protein
MTALCINIDNGVEWELARQQFETIGMEVERFQAIVEDNRPLAFNKSIYGALSLMPEGGWLFEDDVVFTCSLDNIKSAIMQLPSTTLTMHLGCNIFGTDRTVWKMPTRYSERLAVLHNCWQSHATWYSKEAVDFILANLDPTRLDEDNNIFDDWLRRKLLSQGRSYLITPMVAYQRPRHSDIWNVPSDYTGAHIRGNEWLNDNL